MAATINAFLLVTPTSSRFPSNSTTHFAPSTFRSSKSFTTFCVSTKPRRKSEVRKEAAEAEADELVRLILRKFGDEKQPLIATLSKYAKFLRTEHCFRLFEEIGKQDKWLECLEVFRWMQKQRWYVADNGIYSKLISVMGRKGQIRMAMWLFSEMRNSGCRPDTSVYNALISAHLRSRDKAKALTKAYGYFEKMKTLQRCQPNLVTYNILTRAYAQARNTQQVEFLFKDLKENSISPDIYTYNGVLDAYGKNGMIEEMESLLVDMKSSECKPDAITLNVLIDSYGKRQLFDKMEKVFKIFCNHKARPTHATFNSMILNYGKARLREKAESTFMKMKDLGYKAGPITYWSLVTAYGYCDCLSKARAIVDEMMASDEKMPVLILNAMLEAYCMNNLPGEADELLDHACKKGLQPNNSTYQILYKAYTKGSEKDLLRKLRRRMINEGFQADKKFFYAVLKDIWPPQPAETEEGSKTGSDSEDANKKDSPSPSDNEEKGASS